MILVGLRIRIEGFWACKISEEYKNTDFRILDIHPSRDSSRGLIEVVGKQDLKKIRQSLSNKEGITRVENLLDRPDAKLISFYFKHGPLGEIIAQYYTEKLTELIKSNIIKSITLLNMEVPCCFGLQHVIETAVRNSGKVVPIKQTIITIKGQKQQPLEAKAHL